MKIRAFALCLAAFSVCTATVHAQVTHGWQSIFNGENLDGWKIVGDPEWTVENGHISVQGSGQEMGWLVLDGSHSNFIFAARYKWTGGNSGIQIRSRIDDGKMIGYQANLDPGRPTATGSLLEENGRGMLQESKHTADQVFKKDDWNVYEISAIGDHIVVFLNGIKVVDHRDPEGAKEGLIALQMAPGENAAMQWDDIRILSVPERVSMTSLFNGKDFSGWTPIADSTWSVEDGAMVGKSKDGGYGWLISNDEYKNFHFTTRFQMKNGNSGIQFRSKRVEGMVHGLQADIDNRSDWISGHLYDQNGKGSLVKPSQDFSKLIDWDGWNVYEITAIGPKVQLFINGVKSIEYNEAPEVDGIFAFQIHSGIEMETKWEELYFYTQSE